jgi:SPP1 gp7 family putative phage head morphogenesis protein
LTTRTQDQEITKTLTDTLTALLREWAQAGANFGREQVERIIFGTKQVGGVAIDWQLANNAAADWAVEYGRTLSGLLLKTTNERIQKEVAAFIRGEGELKDLIERVRGGHLYSFSRAQTIAVTEVTRAYAQGNMAAWRESGVTQGKEWSTAEDELVCPLCGPLADVVVDLDADFPNGGGSGPPRHTRCRCWVVPVPIGDV